MKYTFFWGGPFSNWYPAEFEYKGYTFSNSEQAFMWEKAMVFNDQETANEILEQSDPRLAKQLGRLVKNFDNDVWIKNRENIMYDVCYAKFSQNPHLKEEILKHNNFVEASPEDTIWGIGLHESNPLIKDPKNWKGLNLLGVALQKVRNSLLLE